jgi:muramoyltetrapeptide carboxypeptidase LdcA involved in peptidoglycan recycling
MTSRPTLKAPRLAPGSTVGIVSPSWGGAGLLPHRVAQGVRHLEALGFKARLAPNALHQHDFVSDTPENRAADLHAMFADREVRAVVAAIGGDHACHLLPLLDYDLIRANPKIFMGYSDITVLNVALWHQTGLVTFNGPMLLPDFGESPRMLDYTETYFLKAIAGDGPVGVVAPAAHWTEEFLDWEQKEDLRRPRAQQPSAGWVWLKPGQVEGRLLGGALESLQHLRGTSCWPDWDDSILFFETTEEKPSPETVDGILMDYENMGVLEKLRGMLVGRAMRYSPEEKQRLRERILERTQNYTFPIITDMDFGHTAPQFTLPLGCRARIDSQSQTFAILDPAVV